MWIASKFGFFSITRSPHYVQAGVNVAKRAWQVRARRRKDLENLLFEMAIRGRRIIETSDSDYRFRFIVQTDTEIALIFDTLQESIDYDNFKGIIGVTRDQKDKLPFYHDVWGIMQEYQFRLTPRTGRKPPAEPRIDPKRFPPYKINL